jgi:peroxiredoxin
VSAKVLIAVLIGSTAVVAGALNLPRGVTAAPQGAKMLMGKAPAFSAKGPDGKTHDLAGLIKDSAGYLYFIKKDCPINAQAVTFYNQLYTKYGAKTPLLGVFNGSGDEYKIYQKDHHMPFPVVLDPDQKIVSAYSAERSPWVVEVTQTQIVGRVWKGYDQEYLQQINQSLADAVSAPVAKMDFSAAPKEPRYG